MIMVNEESYQARRSGRPDRTARSGNPAREQSNVCDQHPGGCARNRCLEVFREPATAIEPGERPFNHPAPWQDLEAFGCVRSFYDFDLPLAHSAQFIAEFVAGIAAIGEDVTQPRTEVSDCPQHLRRAVAVLNVGRMHQQTPQVAEGVGDDVPFAALDL